MPADRIAVPDLAGFVASRKVLWDRFGVPMDFLIPQPAVYDSSVLLNEFGEPLDPWVTPISGGDNAFTRQTVTVTLVTRPYGGRGQVRDQAAVSPLGWWDQQWLGACMQLADYALVGPEGSLGEAKYVEFYTERFEIHEWRPDGIAGFQRVVVYITQAAEAGSV